MQHSGWRPMPLALKVVVLLSMLWVVGSLFALPGRYSLGLPLFGVFVTGALAVSIVLLLDILGPLALVYGAWFRKSWTPRVAYVYLGVFILNSAVALFTFSRQLGVMPIAMPAVVDAIFLLVVYRLRAYFA